MAKGLFIVMEGIDGSGKSTQAKILVSRLEEYVANSRLNKEIVHTAEPGGTALGASIKSITHHGRTTPEAEFFLQMAARTEHMQKVIRPALERGDIVVCDRFSRSTQAYQGVGKGIDQKLLQFCDSYVRCGISPDLEFIFVINPEEAYRRSVGRDANPSHYERVPDTMARVARYYNTCAKQPNPGVIALDATKDAFRLSEEVWNAFLALEIGRQSVNKEQKEHRSAFPEWNLSK